jgi:hypothetical protein
MDVRGLKELLGIDRPATVSRIEAPPARSEAPACSALERGDSILSAADP